MRGLTAGVMAILVFMHAPWIDAAHAQTTPLAFGVQWVR
jgi:hypothetical protein